MSDRHTAPFDRIYRQVNQRIQARGAFALLLGPLPGSMQVWFVHWVIRLRDAAWRNARVLATMDKRNEREMMLARASAPGLTSLEKASS